MKVRHWVAMNNSGMHHAARAMAEAEARLGLDAALVDCTVNKDWDSSLDADLHVHHTHFPDLVRWRIRNRTGRFPTVVFVAHGTPEHVIDTSIEQAVAGTYGASDGWMLLRRQLQHAAAIVTFWPRHAALYQTMVRPDTPIEVLPLGVDRAWWEAGVSPGKYDGQPSVWMSENQHRIKWALDVLLAWPFVYREVPQARLHAHYLPSNIHRFFIDLANTNGAAYTSYLSAATFPHETLRHIFKSVDFLLSPVRYGDFNVLSLQAAAAGLPVISYTGNPYATYWITEGDQRGMADQLVSIFQNDGRVSPRNPDTVPSLEDMGRAAVALYERVIGSPLPSDVGAPDRVLSLVAESA